MFESFEPYSNRNACGLSIVMLRRDKRHIALSVRIVMGGGGDKFLKFESCSIRDYATIDRCYKSTPVER
jgi:hypothetical protein